MTPFPYKTVHLKLSNKFNTFPALHTSCEHIDTTLFALSAAAWLFIGQALVNKLGELPELLLFWKVLSALIRGLRQNEVFTD